MVKVRHWRDKRKENIQNFEDEKRRAQKAEFLRVLKIAGRVLVACDETKIGITTVYRWKDDDPEFAQAWVKAKAQARSNVIESLEEVAMRRANDGSDKMIVFLLQSYRPKTYRERTEVEHKGKVLIWDATKPVKESPLPS